MLKWVARLSGECFGFICGHFQPIREVLLYTAAARNAKYSHPILSNICKNVKNGLTSTSLVTVKILSASPACSWELCYLVHSLFPLFFSLLSRTLQTLLSQCLRVSSVSCRLSILKTLTSVTGSLTSHCFVADDDQSIMRTLMDNFAFDTNLEVMSTVFDVWQNLSPKIGVHILLLLLSWLPCLIFFL